jgi:hypothetical protein
MINTPKVRSTRLFCLAVILTFLWVGCSEKNPKQAGGQEIYDFLLHTETAQVAPYDRDRVRFGEEFTINQDKRAVLFEHPHAEVQFNGIAISQGAVLQFGIGINQSVWDKPGDGVTFEITVIDQKSAKTMIFSQYIDAKNNYRDRKWFEHSVELKDFAGQKVSFIFRTTPGPRGDGTNDWAGWSTPQIKLPGNGG